MKVKYQSKTNREYEKALDDLIRQYGQYGVALVDRVSAQLRIDHPCIVQVKLVKIYRNAEGTVSMMFLTKNSDGSSQFRSVVI